MVQLIITETGKSNMPVDILTMQSTSNVFLDWIERIAKNPNKFSVEIILKTDCDELVSERYFEGFNQALEIMKKLAGDLNEPADAGIVGAIFGFLEACAFVNTIRDDIEGDKGESGI